MSADYPDLPYVHARGDGGPRSRTQIIIIHATDNTAPASGEASYATRREDGTSAHYYVDSVQTIQALPIGNIAFGALGHGNAVGVQYELCGRSNQLTDPTIRRAATQVARDCARYGIPVRKLTPAQIRAGERGICGHADVTLAWPEDGGDHTDPGSNFPWSTFIGYVAGNPQEDDMAMDPQDKWDLFTLITYGSDRSGVVEEKGPIAVRPAARYSIRALSDRLDAKATAEAARDAVESTTIAGLRTAVDALAAAVKAGGGSVDVAAIRALVEERTEAIRALVERQHAEEMAALRQERDAELAGLRAELAARQAS